MPDYTIETTYHLLVYRNRNYSANTSEEACRAAIEDDDWGDAKNDDESPGKTYVTGIWEGANAAYRGSAVPIPSHFKGMLQRQVAHFEVLLGVLKIMVDGAVTKRPTSDQWIAKGAWAIARGEAILAGAPDPDQPVDTPRLRHVLATLQEEHVRDAIVEILKIDPDLGQLTPGAVTDEEIHAACLTVATTMDFSDEVGTAEFRAALAAIQEARRRLSA